MISQRLIYVSVIILFLGCQQNEESSRFESSWRHSSLERPWAGSDYWLNPLQAWQQKDGKLHCTTSGGDRNAVLLTREVGSKRASFSTSVNFNITNKDTTGWIGWQIGLQGEWDDYRDDAVKGIGLCVGMTVGGELFIGNPEGAKRITAQAGSLHVQVEPSSDELYDVTLSSIGDDRSDEINTTIHGSWLEGLIALTSSQSYASDTIAYDQERPPYQSLSELNKRARGDLQVAFDTWQIAGDKIVRHVERSFGPILWAHHTLSDGVMKMSVQFAPIGNDQNEVVLLVDGEAKQKASIDRLGRNAIFRIVDWDDTMDHSYTIVYKDQLKNEYTYAGTIKRNPEKDVIKMASLSCVDDRGFPHQEVVDHVLDHEPDLVSFHGDQLYERVGGYGVEYNSILDYQRKWYLFGWTFRDLLRDIPAIIIPDDHDVFHGNLWGQGGKAADLSKGFGNFSQDSGGYKETPEFVNMVHRTQTGHLPDPYDNTPVEQNISVYYTRLDYGGISYAILGDRQWKTAPDALMPEAF